MKRMPEIFEPIILFISAVILLRISGKRSIAHMTIDQTVVIISIGAIIVEPFINEGLIPTIFTVALLVALLMLFEYLEFYFSFFDLLFVGKPVIIIEDGKIVEKNAKKLKLTEEELLSRLRQIGLNSIKDIKIAYLETNGKIGYELKEKAMPVTLSDLECMLNEIALQIDPKYKSIDFVKLIEQKKFENTNRN